MKTERYLTAKEIRELFQDEINNSIAHGEQQMKQMFPNEPFKVELIDEAFAIQLYINGVASTRFTCKISGKKLELKFGMFDEVN